MPYSWLLTISCIIHTNNIHKYMHMGMRFLSPMPYNSLLAISCIIHTHTYIYTYGHEVCLTYAVQFAPDHQQD